MVDAPLKLTYMYKIIMYVYIYIIFIYIYEETRKIVVSNICNGR